MELIDSPARIDELRSLLQRKQSLRRFYADIYQRYDNCLAKCPPQGTELELGTGAGFAKTMIPNLVTSDLIPYPGVDAIVDACQMPYADGSLRFICMLNVFHHIPDVKAFFRECERCLVPGGRVLIVDQYLGLVSKPILTYLHHEPIDPLASDWKFETTGPLSGANGALAWIVFSRDREKFLAEFPSLEIMSYRPRSPLLYWLAGGLKKWSLVPGWAYSAAKLFDQWLLFLSPRFGSFVDIELRKR